MVVTHDVKTPEKSDGFKWRKGVMILFGMYMAILLYVTLLAWNYGSSYGEQGPGNRNYSLQPLESIINITLYSDNLIDPLVILAGNILLFIPFGLLLGFIIHPRSKIIWLVPCSACLTSVSIELIQFVFTYRVADVDDVILNTMGGMIGGWTAYSIRWFAYWLQRK